jgi:phosphotransacetylase
VLIWPDLQTGNTASKAMILMGDGMCVGATFLGLNGVVGDHSRGATMDEIRAFVALIGAQVKVKRAG